MIALQAREEIRAIRLLRTLGLTLAGAAAVGALGVLLVRDQMKRHRRNLFSPHPYRRLAALGYIGRHPDVENAHLLRDFLSWEREPMLRRRAASVLKRVEEALSASSDESDRGAGNGQASE